MFINNPVLSNSTKGNFSSSAKIILLIKSRHILSKFHSSAIDIKYKYTEAVFFWEYSSHYRHRLNNICLLSIDNLIE